MKLRLPVFLMLTVACLQVGASAIGQQITLSERNVPLERVFKKLRKQSNVDFVCSSEQMRRAARVTLNVTNQPLKEVLDEIFENQPLIYTLKNKTIVVQDKPTVAVGLAAEYPTETIVETIPVRGRVVDEKGEALPGVSILVKGTQKGMITDTEGKFSIEVPDKDAVLVFSFVGYVSQEIVVGNRNLIEIALSEDKKALDELVVVGYGTTRKSDLTGSIAQIRPEELQAVPVYNGEQALKGRAAGVQVTQNSGQPGDRIKVRVRGGNSVIGDNQPLYVVDGFPMTGGLSFLNPSDIESIDILKDASATAIYGARGANGVVIITSKKGKRNVPGRVEFNTFFGVQQVTKRYDLMDAGEYAVIANEWLKNSNQPPFFNLDEIRGPGTDWQDLVLRSAPIQDHTLSFSGGSERTQYSFSGNYYAQDGILINTGVKRGSARLNLGHDLKDWMRLDVNLNLSRRQQLSVPVNNGLLGASSILSAAASAPPTLPVYDENGLPTRIERAYSFGSADMRNPLIFAEEKTTTTTNGGVGNTSLEIKLSKDLVFKTLAGLEYTYSLTDQYTPIVFAVDRGSARQQVNYRTSFLNENTLTYTKEFNGNHRFTALGGYTYQTDRNRNLGIGVSGFPGNTTLNYDLSAAEVISPPSSGISEWALASWLSRVNYSLADKYLFTASLRADGSSRFGKNNKWASFPSAAVAWRVSNEPFMRDVTQVNELKLRASYGVTGNTALNPYQSLDRMSTGRTIYGNNETLVGYVPSGISNPDLKWETTRQTDIGFEMTVLNHRLNISADYYWKYTTDLLASVPLPPSVGFGSILQNIGEIKNHGFELTLNGDILTGPLKWTASGMLSTNKNKIVKLAGKGDIYSTDNTNIAREGEPLGSFFGYLEDGLTEAGFIQYSDLNRDGVINLLDRVILGKPNPDLIFSLNSSLSYKGVSLGIFLEGIHGNQLYNATDATHLNSFQRGTNQFRDLTGNYWTAENPDVNAKYPKVSPLTSFVISDRFIEDGSYLRLKSINLSYDLPVAKWGMAWCNFLKLYISGTNLLTFTRYTGLDPEMNTRGTDSQNVNDRLRMGHDRSGYPNARIYAMGLRLTF